MTDHDRRRRTQSGPFGLGRQGYVILAIIILGTAFFAATRTDWPSRLVIALVLPVLMVALIHVVSGFRRNRSQPHDGRSERSQDPDLIAFLARTNPFMFLLFSAMSRGEDDERYGELLRSGPYGMGRSGYLVVLAVFLAPLILTLILVASTGHGPAHTGPPLP